MESKLEKSPVLIEERLSHCVFVSLLKSNELRKLVLGIRGKLQYTDFVQE